jgi:hypothetical protein
VVFFCFFAREGGVGSAVCDEWFNSLTLFGKGQMVKSKWWDCVGLVLH